MPEKLASRMAKIQHELEECEAELNEELDAAQANVQNVKARLRKVKVMRRASRANSVESTKPKLPGVNRALVAEIAASLLAAGPLSEEELTDRVAAELRPHHTLAGFRRRINEILNSDLFEKDSAGLVHLSKTDRRSQE